MNNLRGIYTDRGQAVLFQVEDGRLFQVFFGKESDLIGSMEARGFKHTGNVEGDVRPELRGAPTFEGLTGPTWGGFEHPWLYETAEASAVRGGT